MLQDSRIHWRCRRVVFVCSSGGEFKVSLYYRICNIIFGVHKAQNHLRFLCTQSTKTFALRCSDVPNPFILIVGAKRVLSPPTFISSKTVRNQVDTFSLCRMHAFTWFLQPHVVPVPIFILSRNSPNRSMLCGELLVPVATLSLSNRQTSCFFVDGSLACSPSVLALATTTEPSSSITQQKQSKRHSPGRVSDTNPL
jgi:hypothetical protein